MSDAKQDRIKSILDAAMGLPEAQRSGFLDEACKGDADLRNQVEQLLSWESAGVEEGIGADQTRIVPAAVDGRPSQAPAGGAEYVGSYRIIETIGEGGMGVVYKAEQLHPRRIVALKVVRASSFSQGHLKRFELEAEVLGRLQHPGIARIYEAGMAPGPQGGLPFFAMEFISGQTLLARAQARNLTVRQRLELLLKICDAVHYAHQKGVIHRDLKPGNILVDENGTPKVLDFGVARLTDSDVQLTIQTHMGQIIGSLPYMSPEQAGGDPSDLDTRSDVYALGVIAYELLAGRRPYSLDKRILAEAIRIIREEEPTSLSSINRGFRGDIETIIGKALAKDKDRRYASVSDLAGDIRRHLSNEPIAARRPSTWYQASKFARRNKAVVAGVAAVMLALAIGMVATSLQTSRARRAERDLAVQFGVVRNQRDEVIRARDRANSNAAKAQRSAAEARAVADFLQKNVLAAARPLGWEGGLGYDITLRQALDRAAPKIASSFADQPLVEASVREVLGDTYGQLGECNLAIKQLARALELRQTKLGSEHLDTARAMDLLGTAYKQARMYEQAKVLIERALVVRERLLPADHPDIAGSLATMGDLYVAQWEGDLAEPFYKRAIAIEEKVFPPDDPEAALTLEGLGTAYFMQEKYSLAETFYKRALAIQEKALPPGCPYISSSLQGLAQVLHVQQKYSQAEALYKRAVAIDEKALPLHHHNRATGLHNLACLYAEWGKYDKAGPLFQRALAMEEESLPADHPTTATTLEAYSELLKKMKRTDEAAKLSQRAAAIRKAHAKKATATQPAR